MPSKRTLEWRDKQKGYIERWKKTILELRSRSFLERWNEDKYEMELLQCLENQTLKDVFIFAKNYVMRVKSGKFRTLMTEVNREIKECGTVEPSRLNFLKHRIEIVKEKMK
ncbi:MAG: hypothetical protein A2Z91_09120 [Deltaproteobacteria bacterium GWA2_38_16]|nr:MAG: hypothetical protein A2Z91_09120 [Deltaproteobacteria bacterium GWA2_38_16]OGQ02541.1 MAG: hypothetical protein A3D19_09610 [Deltaproteobacteria bacterium RIFCSPHIGHO2_02_FULL_38_15]OGQ34131.1 MAG: hypothetical protein A3A72_04025 [Deltaproteobacteria bacterium RIFCSPLOWO2_01_FULL_38_9]OGQ60369.1 MAG: hypothetical protein A3G92_03260 [Deltaproteobacteria bacterium RIFCSPLOWO2_12_FULL_38_8]HBQ21004.1 hypothetical protein [Deltaproteobacteria bacterium]